MTILNIENIPYIGDYEVSIRKFSSLPLLLNLDDSTDYWYVEFKYSLVFIDQAIPKNILEKIKKKEIILVLANIHESFHNVVDKVYNVINELELPEENVILVSESADILSRVKSVAKEKNKSEIKVLWSRVFEAHLHFDARNNRSTANTLEFKKYEKKFLNLNRRWRLHRPLFVALMIGKNLLDKGHISLGKSDDNKNWKSIWEQLIHYNSPPYNSSCPEIIELLEKNKEKILSTPRLYLDTNDLMVNRADQGPETDKFYNETYFSVVSETNYYTTIGDFDSGRFFSEKTFKPIFNRHPFILLSPPNSLDMLRQLGYKTFHPYINETYDFELNDFNRMMLIIKEVERLCNFSDSEVEEFIRAVKPICEFNFNLLYNKNDKYDFVRKLN